MWCSDPDYGQKFYLFNKASRSQRVIQHHPCSGKSVFLMFQLRRYYCCHKKCQRLTFIEYVGPFAEHYQCVSKSLLMIQTKLSMVAGGEAGSRLATVFRLRISGD